MQKKMYLSVINLSDVNSESLAIFAINPPYGLFFEHGIIGVNIDKGSS